MKKYYKNMECEIIKEINDQEVVIEILGADYEKVCYECTLDFTSRKIVVKKSEIKDKLFTQEEIYEKLIKFEEDEMYKIKKRLNDKEDEVRKEIYKIEKNKNELMKKYKNNDYIEGLEYIIKSSGVDKDFNGYIMKNKKFYKIEKYEEYRYMELIYNFENKHFFVRLTNNIDDMAKADIFKSPKDVINECKENLIYAIKNKKIDDWKYHDFKNIYDGLSLVNYKGIMSEKIKKHLDYLNEKEKTKKIKVIEDEIERLNKEKRKIKE